MNLIQCSGCGSGSFSFPLKVLSRLKKYENFLAKYLILIIKHIFSIWKFKFHLIKTLKI